MGCETEGSKAGSPDATDALVHGLVAVGARWCDKSRSLHLCETSLHCPLPVSRLQWRLRRGGHHGLAVGSANDIGGNGGAVDAGVGGGDDDSGSLLLALPVYLNASRSTFVAEVGMQRC